MTLHAVRTALLAAASLMALAAPLPAGAQSVTLTIESWRNDDLEIWQKTIIPAFKAKHPGIEVVFAPTAPAEYNAALNAKLDAGSAGDLVTCRPFDAALQLYERKHLAPLSDLAGMENFAPIAKTAWSTDDGKTTFCVPMASVIHGFIYNKAAFAALKLEPPKTEAEFKAVLDKIKADGTYVALDLGTKDQWEAATVGYQNIGPNYWQGEVGRQALIDGRQKLTDEAWVQPYRVIAGWRDYLVPGFEAQSYPDSQNLFTLGRAAIYPAGSWEISGFKAQADFEMGAFPPPLPAGASTCYISDHTDIALGMNAKTKNPAAAKTFLSWVASPEFATLYANALPGFFSLAKAPVELKEPLAKEFVSWRQRCQSTIRSTYQILSRGVPNLENETWNASANIINGTETPEAAAARLQQGLASWYAPQKR